MLYASSNSCRPEPAASARPSVTNWLSVFLVRIIFTAHLLTRRRLIACRAGRRVDRLLRWPAVWWILRSERTPVVLHAFLRATAEFWGSGHRTGLYRSRASIHWHHHSTLSESLRATRMCSREWPSCYWLAHRRPQLTSSRSI